VICPQGEKKKVVGITQLQGGLFSGESLTGKNEKEEGV